MNAYSIQDIIGFLNSIYGGQELFISPYQYSLDIGAVAAGETVTRNLQITANQDFVVTELNIFNAVVLLDTTLLLTDNGSGNTLTYGPCPILSIANATFSFGNVAPLMFPWLLEGRGSVSALISCGDASSLAANAALVFDGFNVRGA